MIHRAVAHPSASLSRGHIKSRSKSGHSAKVSVGGEGSGDEANHEGRWWRGGGGLEEEEGNPMADVMGFFNAEKQQNM